MCNWFQRNETTISAIASSLTAIGIIVAILALAVTFYQLDTTADNIKASTVYTIGKDGREIAQQFKKKNVGVGYLFNYIHAAWHQKRLGTLDDRLWKPIENEICAFLKHEQTVERYWKGANKMFFDPGFVRYIDRLRNTPECKRGS